MNNMAPRRQKSPTVARIRISHLERTFPPLPSPAPSPNASLNPNHVARPVEELGSVSEISGDGLPPF